MADMCYSTKTRSSVTSSASAEELLWVALFRDRFCAVNASCPECDATITFAADAVEGEIVACPDCGVELEVVSLAPLKLALAAEVGEDWGE